MVCSTTRSWHDHLHHHHKHRPQFNFNLKKLAYPLKCIFQAFSCSCEPSIVFLDSSREQGNRRSIFQKPNVPADSSVHTWTIRRITSCTTVSCPHLGTSSPTCLATVSLAQSGVHQQSIHILAHTLTLPHSLSLSLSLVHPSLSL